MPTVVYLYLCVNKKCPNHRRELEGPSPATVRAATGRSLSCALCGVPLALHITALPDREVR